MKIQYKSYFYLSKKNSNPYAPPWFRPWPITDSRTYSRSDNRTNRHPELTIRKKIIAQQKKRKTKLWPTDKLKLKIKRHQLAHIDTHTNTNTRTHTDTHEHELTNTHRHAHELTHTHYTRKNQKCSSVFFFSNKLADDILTNSLTSHKCFALPTFAFL